MASVLQIRLKNCIQTILDLEPAIRERGENEFEDDFHKLKSYLRRVDEMELGEDDVSRLEYVTAAFLSELKKSTLACGPLSRVVQ